MLLVDLIDFYLVGLTELVGEVEFVELIEELFIGQVLSGLKPVTVMNC